MDLDGLAKMDTSMLLPRELRPELMDPRNYLMRPLRTGGLPDPDRFPFTSGSDVYLLLTPPIWVGIYYVCV